MSKGAVSLVEELRSRTDLQITELFLLRPDLTAPVPTDFSALSARATSAPSLVRALEGLNKFQYQILEAITALDESITIEILMKATEPAAKEAVDDLWKRALIYYDKKILRTPRAIREMLGSQPAGLGPISLNVINFPILESAPPLAKEILKRLTWGPPKGAIGDRKKTGKAVDWLIENNFLIKVDNEHVALPREVGIHLRGGKIHQELFIKPAKVLGDSLKNKEIDLAAIAAISNILRWIAELMDFWSEETPIALRTGGLGARDLKKAALHLGVDESCAAFVVEVAFLAGLIAIESNDAILPSPQFDLWQMKSPESQWEEIASLWLISSRVVGLITRGQSRGIAPLGSELDRIWAQRIRRLILSVLEKNPNICVAVESAKDWIDWLAPSRRGASLHHDFIEWTLSESEWLGITGRGALSSFGEKLLTRASDLNIDKSLPKAIDHILIQADYTAIAPGPLTVEIARILSTFADIESRGSATVYRFSEGSIRRGLDHGHSGDEIKKFLQKTSKTPLPQPLEYLIADVSKRHGKLRVGYANTYIRCEDTSTISQIIFDKRLVHLRLREIAPGVLISESESGDALEELRNNGYLPSLESNSGSVLAAPKERRSKVRARPPRNITDIAISEPSIIEAAVRSLRAGERATGAKSLTRDLPRNTANETLTILKKCIEEGSTISIGYADTNGGVSSRVIDPISVAMGNLIATDHGNKSVTEFKISRITGVSPI